jgi:kynurenine formamidase
MADAYAPRLASSLDEDALAREVAEIAPRVRNWGRWGADDQLGTLNFITPAKRAAAARLVRKGVTFSLQIPMDQRGPMAGPIRVNPVHTMTATGCDHDQAVPMLAGARYTDDTMFLYLQSGTEWDGLSHVFYDGKLYNGYDAACVDSRGSARLGMEQTCSSYVSRGVLLDVARFHGVECLHPLHRIDGDELDAVAAAQGVVIESGDIILLRTGILSEYAQTGRWTTYHGSHPGLHHRAACWLHDHEIAAIAADNGSVEGIDKSAPLAIPLHQLALRDMGLPLGETFNLEALAEDCAADGVYECFLVAPALKITGAVGSPVNPLAMK